jgi:glycosidase
MMSIKTNTDLRKLFIYQVYIRNHTKEGTFKAFIKDLDRIKTLGVDVVYLLPIHPIGQKNKKGDLGCPYSISDYGSVNPEYGTLDDFKELVSKVHDKGMKLMIDVVYNHTSYDSVLLKDYPEFFYKKDGAFANRVGEWWDVTDLDYTKSHQLWDILIDYLLYWTKLGVDGFRWDVASLLPLDFLKEAHEKVMDVNPNSIFLSESVHGEFLREFRNEGFDGLSESEVYQVFDMAYDYDTHPTFLGYLKGENNLQTYVDEILKQESVFPKNYVKMRNLENHDFGRFAELVDSDISKIDNWTAFVFFNKGCTMIYAGQEKSDNNLPSLFDLDKVNWDGYDISKLIRKMAKIVKADVTVNGVYDLKVIKDDVIVGSYKSKNEILYGIFNMNHFEGEINLDLENGSYLNLIDDTEIMVKDGKLKLSKYPLLFWVKK